MIKDFFTVVIPVYNEEHLLNINIPNLIKYLNMYFKNYEILLVENGSTDNSLKVIQNLAKKFKQISYLSLPKADYGNAISVGIKESKENKIIWIPVDYNIELLPFINDAVKYLNDYDLVLGSKRKGKDLRGWKSVFVNRTYNFFIRRLFNLGVADVEGYKGCNKKEIIGIVNKITSKGHLFDLELLIIARKNRLKIYEVPVVIKELRDTSTINTPKKFMKAVLNSFRTFFRLKLRYM